MSRPACWTTPDQYANARHMATRPMQEPTTEPTRQVATDCHLWRNSRANKTPIESIIGMTRCCQIRIEVAQRRVDRWRSSLPARFSASAPDRPATPGTPKSILAADDKCIVCAAPTPTWRHDLVAGARRERAQRRPRLRQRRQRPANISSSPAEATEERRDVHQSSLRPQGLGQAPRAPPVRCSWTGCRDFADAGVRASVGPHSSTESGAGVSVLHPATKGVESVPWRLLPVDLIPGDHRRALECHRRTDRGAAASRCCTS